MTTDTHTPRVDMTAGDMLMTLNGFDEIAIAGKFNRTLADLRSEASAITLGRALAFIHFRREGMKDTPAWEAAMALTLDDVTKFFKRDPKAKKKAKKAKKKTAAINGVVAGPSLTDGGPDAEGEG